MSAADQNEINFQKRAMQKAYYNPMQHFQNYFQNENGFCYDMAPSYGQQNATDYYGSSCVLQSHMSAGGEPAAGQEYGNTYCMQTSGLTCNPGVASVNPNPSILKQQEIYPWMKESRQNSKQRQATNLSECEQPAKRARTAYTSAQLVELEKEFHFNRYLCRPRRIEMAALLNLTERQIKIWFQNRRMKYKKEQKQKNVDKQGKLDGSNPGSDTDSQGSMKSMTLPNNEQTLKSMSDALESFRQRSSPSPRRNVPTTPEVFPSPNSNSTNSLPPPPPPQNACLPVVGGGGSSTCAISSDRPPLSYAPQSTSPGYPQMLPHHSNQSYMSSLLEDTTFHLVHSSPGTPCLRNDPRQDSYTYIPKLTHL